MIKDCKLYECDLCGASEIVEEGCEPIDTVSFKIYDLKPCICKRCLKLAVDAFNAEKVKEKEKEILKEE